MKKGLFIIISGPGGVGKDTIVNRLIKEGYGIYSVSMTTRQKRPNEVEGKDYFFVTKEEFQKNIQNNNLFEYVIYNNNYYGTPKKYIFDNINKGINVISILDVEGAIKVEEKYSDTLSIFIMPPNKEELEKRLKKRNTDNQDIITQRLNIASKEIKYKNKYDYIVINDNLDIAISQIKDIITKSK